jgi:hypothetical protein
VSVGFHKSSDVILTEREVRRHYRQNMLTFGVDFLDDAMEGILKNDLVLVGAHSGGGKTQFCCNIAAANVSQGKRVHYLALEAEHAEIERRILYQLFTKHYYADPERPRLEVSFQKWMLGDFIESGFKYETEAAHEFEQKFTSLFTFYKQGSFDVHNFIAQVVLCADETDLIIVDHVHYFDFEDDNENRAIREIAKTARTLALEQGKPIILVSHIRKRDRNNTDMVPGQEEFHGSSDLFKIATKAITLAPGAWGVGGKLETFFRIVKNRHEGSVTRFIASTTYLSSEGRYEKGYKLGDSNQKRDRDFEALLPGTIPRWAKRVSHGENGGEPRNTPHAHKTLVNHAQRGTRTFNVGEKQD